MEEVKVSVCMVLADRLKVSVCMVLVEGLKVSVCMVLGVTYSEACILAEACC